MKEIKDLNTWRYRMCLQITRLITVKMSVLSEMMYDFNIIPKKSSKNSIDTDKPL